MIVPRREKPTAQVATSNHQVFDSPPAKPLRRMGGLTLRLLWPIAAQALQSYAAIWLERQIREYMQQGPGPPPQTSEETRESDARRKDAAYSIPNNFR